ncbi:hypothetical protein RINTHH_4260 [Richelia intracellularis HH01]|jgi:hypothetical protein|uniref:Uncharacterized protein n=1 Tax=Richelia intracellularis HH01 TaxID=1165094 RepID=M1X4R7_9NOST|nr:hypothetical protein [Richelia intracellularis]CCH66581.1 hypothetical protein RINTHH_4260 [Richelia intracellularis HH01]
MSIIALRTWYLQKYEPIKELEKRPPDLRISKKSLLKSGLRADFLEDSKEVKQSTWFRRYLEGEDIEFYVEGSGSYCVANLDLISHEIYFTKQTLLAQLEPTIFFSSQLEYAEASDSLRKELQTSINKLNERSRWPLTFVESYRPKEDALRLSSTMMRKIRRSLLFIADTTPITKIQQQKNVTLIPSPHVCVEIGYAIESKRTEQIVLAQMERLELNGEYPFEWKSSQVIRFQSAKELSKALTQTIENQLVRFKLFI